MRHLRPPLYLAGIVAVFGLAAGMGPSDLAKLDKPIGGGSGASGEAPQVSPVPRYVQARSEVVHITPVVGLVSGEDTDPYALEEVEEILESAGAERIERASDKEPAPRAPLTVWVGGPSENKASADALGALGVDGPAGMSPEGYVLAAGRGSGKARIVLAGADPRGTFYAAQTLRQLVETNPGPARVSGVEIRDWPAMETRGVIEGFYGPPWSHDDRLSQISFYGAHKMNTYVYAPKDDPYHREKWREPYPQDRLAELEELVGAAKRQHVDFVFAVSPGLDTCYSDDDDFEALADKAREMWDVGVRSFAVFFDDIGRELNCQQDVERFGDDPSPAAAAEAYLLNRFVRGFVKPREGADRLITVPIEYAGVGDSTYRSRFADLVDPSVIVYWTGREVVSKQIPAADARAAHDVFAHDLLLWDNYPVNDYATNRLFLGPLVGRAPNLSDHGVIGLTSNAMVQAEASKIALFTAADYAWNAKAYDSRDSWVRGLREIGDAAYPALRTFAENSMSSPLSEEESSTLAPLIRDFWEAYESGRVGEEADRLARAFEEAEQAPGILRDRLGNAAFLGETQPWLDKLGLYGAAGHAAVRMLVSERSGDYTRAWNERVAFEEAYARAREIFQEIAPGVVDPFLDRARGESNLVQISSPEEGARFGPGETATVTAEVRSGGVPISGVEFFAGPEKIGEDHSAPYELEWKDPHSGFYVLTARATDGNGASVTSASVRITVGDPQTALFVVGGEDPLSRGDAAVEERIEYLGYPVEVMTAREAQASDAADRALVVVSSTVSSGDVNTKFRDVRVPVLTWESFVFDDLGMADQVGEEFRSSEVRIAAPDHPMAAGRSGDVTVYRGQDRIRWGVVNDEAITVATLPGSPDRAALFGYGQGASMLDLSAPDRRVGLFLGDSGVGENVITDDGLALFDAAVYWATGREVTTAAPATASGD